MSNKITIIADSTALQAFGECPQLWAYGIRDRLTPNEAKDSSEAAQMGTYGHRLLDVYYKAIAEGENPTRAFDKSMSHDIDKDHCECGHPVSDHAIAFGAGLVCQDRAADNSACRCNAIRYQKFDLDLDKRQQVRDRLRLYLFTYSRNDIVPASPDHVEIGFSEIIYEDCEHLFVLEGRIDLIGTNQGIPCIADHKFQLRERELYKKSIQFRNYAMITNQNMLVLNMIRLAKSVTPKTFERPIASFTSAEHEWWRGELIKRFKRMAYAQRYNEYYKEWSACSGKFGYKCDFTTLCEETSQLMEATKRDTLYRIKPEWRPW